MEQPIVIDNLDTVKKRLSNAGFGDRFDKVIEDMLAQGATSMTLQTSAMFENKKMDFEPEINVKDTKGYYNGFKATLHQEDGAITTQWFKASDRLTMDDAYILLMDQQHPRAVNKTYFDEAGKKYTEWIQLDFNQKTDSENFLTKRYGEFDQVAKLSDFQFVELATATQKINAAAHMSEGREIIVTPVNQENHSEVFMRANPERKTFTFLDNDGKLLKHDQFRTPEARERIAQERSENKSNVNLVKGDKPATEGPDGEKKNNSQHPAESMKSSQRPRVVQDNDNKKGQSL